MIFTFKDAIDSLVDWTGANPQPHVNRHAKRALLAALDELAQSHHWSYFYSTRYVTTSAPYSTGTIAYDQSGGTYDRMVTLTDGTWPDWAEDGVLRIGVVNYSVSARVSDSIIQLAADSNPGDDVAAGTTYTLYRDSYNLPSDLWTIDDLHSEEIGQSACYVHPREWLGRQRLNSTSSNYPTVFTVMGSDDYQSITDLFLYPYPDSQFTLAYIYSRRPRPLVFEAEKTGTVSNTAGSLTITGSGTAFTAAMVGSIIRLSGDAAEYPTSLTGANPAVIERTVMGVDSATSLTVDEQIATPYTGVKFLISDAIDIDVGLMGRALMRCAEAQLGKLMRLEDRTALDAEWMAALIKAKEADSRSTGERAVGGRSSRVRLTDYQGFPAVADVE